MNILVSEWVSEEMNKFIALFNKAVKIHRLNNLFIL
jgi:hypothetical protein